MVTQDIHLFHASLRDNLSFFDRTVPDERIIAVLEDLGMGEWYRSLPEGLDTRLAPGGSTVSAGQGQLFAFAPEVLQEPRLGLPGEGPAPPHPAPHRHTQHALDQQLQDPTALILAH